MNFNFPPPSPIPERQRLPALAALVLAAHGALALLPAPSRPMAGRPGRIPSPDDTPELLRLSRGPGAAAPRPAGLPLGLLPPPPPPSLLPGTPAAATASPRPAAAVATAGLTPPALPVRLADAVAALRSQLAEAPTAALAAGDRDALVALQRRQWWLSAAQEPLAQQLWQRATPVETAPTALGRLPESSELGRLPDAAPSPLAAGDHHGRSLLGRETALLLWRQGGGVWLVRLPLGRKPENQTLTSP